MFDIKYTLTKDIYALDKFNIIVLYKIHFRLVVQTTNIIDMYEFLT